MTEDNIQSPPSNYSLSTSKWLLVILIAAAFLRFAFLGSSPPDLFRDEVEKGYNAWSLVKRGEALSVNSGANDATYGYYYQVVKFPIFLNVYDSHTSMIYQYMAAPFILVLGRNSYGVRATAAMAGLLTVLFTFLFVREWCDEKTALWAAAFLAVSPWHVMFSRWAQQGITVPLFITIGLFAFYRGLAEAETETKAVSRKSWRWWMISAAAFALAFYAYAAARLFIPLFLLLLFAINAKALIKKWKWFVPALGLFLILSLPTILFILSPESRERYTAVSGGSNVSTFFINWLKHLSPGFLFFKGDANPRHSFPGFGQLHVFEVLLWLAAIPALFRLPRRVAVLIIGWLVLFPIPASITTEGVPHALRSIVALPLPAIISAIGLMEIDRYLKKRLGANNTQDGKAASFKRYLLVVRMAGALAAIIIVFFIYTMFVLYPRQTPQYWSYPENALFQSAIFDNLTSNSDVWVSSRLFYAPYFAVFYLEGHNNWKLGKPNKPMDYTIRERPNGRAIILKGMFFNDLSPRNSERYQIPEGGIYFATPPPPTTDWQPEKQILTIPWPESISDLTGGLPAVEVKYKSP